MAILINGLWFIVKSPSEYIYRDFPGVSIKYDPKIVHVKAKLTPKVVPKPRKKPHGGKRIKTKNVKPRFKITKVLLRRWILCDGTVKQKFATLTEACSKLRQVMRDYHTGTFDV